MLKRMPWRPLAALTVLLVTAAVFIDYFASHTAVRQQLGRTSPAVLGWLLGLYLVFIGSLALINAAAQRLCRAQLPPAETLLLTMYSSLINFFGPLQSGPAFRAIYLKQKHGVKLKDYTAASFGYYFFYGLFSGLCLVSSLLGWWLVVPAVIILAAAYKYRPRLGGWHYLAAATLLQVVLWVIIYYVELHAVAPGVSLGQVITYTGAANFALFVSITPGAIGFREAFLVFSQRLHHIDGSTIVAANLIDRSVYIMLLLILVAGIFGSHAHRRFRTASW